MITHQFAEYFRSPSARWKKVYRGGGESNPAHARAERNNRLRSSPFYGVRRHLILPVILQA